MSSSDLSAASVLSRALSRRSSASGAEAPARPAYVRIARPAPEPTTGLPAPSPEIGTWEAFLAWSLELTRAHAGFVVDSQGFVIASRGNVPKDGFEGIGAELCYAMDQLWRINPAGGPLRLLELQFEANRIIGIRVDAPGLGTVLVGFQGTRSLADETRDSLIRLLGRSLPGFA